MSNSAEYWRRRFSILEEAAHKKAERAVRALEELYREAQISVNKEIESWYGRFATNNGISLAEARKWLAGNQLEEFHWTVEQYIKVGEQAGLSEEWLKKLENASAKFHISRLEAVQTGIQQQIELLYGKQTDTIDRLLRDVAGSGYTHAAYEVQKGIGVGWNITALDGAKLDTFLSKPWTTDGRTFSDRLWLQQKDLVKTLQKELTQGLLRGDSTQKITEAVRKSLKVSRNQAARLVYTETAYFQALADKKSYEALGVKNVEIIETLDSITCATCQGFDGKIVPLSQFEPAVTVPPYHPHCRGTTAPAIDDEEGKRIARNAEGKTYYVPADMSYEEWIAKQKGLYGKETVEKLQKMAYNENADKEQYKRYKECLGADAPKSFKEFQNLKYSNPDGYAIFKTAYADKRLQIRLQSDPAYATLKVGQQGKHILGHNNYTEGRSYLIISMDEAQELIKRYAGTGEIKRDNSGKWTHKEFVTVDRVIGYHFTPDGVKTPTRRFSINYATGKNKGAHIVPAKEE